MPALLFALLFSPPRALAADLSTSTVFEIYGSARVSERELEEALGPLARRYVGQRASASGKAEERVSELRRSIEDEARSRWGLLWARLEPPRALETGGEYLSLEVVEPAQKAARMPFRAHPRGREEDPAGLLAAWEDYSEEGWRRVRTGEAKIDRVECPAYFCTWGSASPELAALEGRFIAEVPAQSENLLRVLERDADGERRAAALYLLAYSKNGGEVCALAGEALLDPEEPVREAGMRILSDIALNHPNIHLPLERVLAALDYPYSEDRTRALAVLLAIAENPEYRSRLLKRAAPIVLRLLRLKHPGNHAMAHAVLGMLSKRTIAGDDYGAWEDWLKTAVSSAAVVSPR